LTVNINNNAQTLVWNTGGTTPTGGTTNWLSGSNLFFGSALNGAADSGKATIK